MSESQRDFTTYEPGDNPAALAGGVLKEIAEATNFDLSATPTEEEIKDLTGSIARNREFQENIGRVSKHLGSDATEVMADWVERSGVLKPVERAFTDPSIPLPNKFGFVVVQSDVVMNWFLRRKGQAERLDPEAVGELLLVAGTRKVKPGEHQLAATINRNKRREADLVEEKDEPKPETDEEKKAQKKEREEHYPTAPELLKTLRVIEGLKAAGFNAHLIEVDGSSGREVLNGLIEQRPALLENAVMAIGNAPSTIQAAGQLQDAARRIDAGFNSSGDQLFMKGDTIQVARNGESPATHQNPETALGQIVRNAKYVLLNQK